MKKTFILSTLLLLICVPWHIEAQGQGRSVSGVVADDSGNALIGAAVTIPGTQTVAITDENGAFTIMVPGADAVLNIAYLGFQTDNITVGNRDNIFVELTPDAASLLDEVVVVGYGVQQKKLVTGATVQVKGDDIAKMNTTSALGALQSQTPGVNIVQVGGMPNQGYKVNIRGAGTIGNSEPLYVIDGVSSSASSFNLLNPSDIQSIDVLKDAASAAIYGSRAANGVILITTKQGRKGDIQVSLDGYYGWQNPYRLPQMLDAQEYAAIMQEARLMDGLAPYDFAAMVPNWESISNGSFKGTNWLKESVNKNAPTQNYTMNVTGGTDLSVFSFGLGYTQQEGVLGHPAPPEYERYTARLNSEFTLFKGRSFDIVKLGENLTYAHTVTPVGMGMGDMYGNDVGSLMRMSPFMPVFDENGEYSYAMNSWDVTQENPIGRRAVSKGTSLNKNNVLRSSLYLTVQPIKNLIFRSTFGYAFSSYNNRNYSPLFNLGTGPGQFNNVESVGQYMGVGTDLSWENTLTYTFDINDDHNFTLLAGQSIEKGGGPLGESLGASSANPLFHDLRHAYLDNANVVAVGSTSIGGAPYGMRRLASFFGRVSYDYQNKYMLTAVLRADGSSNFARGKRWGYFPSVSAGWVVTEESFMESTRSWMDFLKIRASWGQNGNQAIDPFQYLSTITTDGRYTFGPDKASSTIAAYPEILPNKDVSWETSEQIDLGLDARFLRSRLGLAFDFYVKTTKDWLVPAPILGSYGAGAPWINGGDIRNRGVEIALDWNDTAGEFRYGANVNLTFNSNEITRIANAEGIIHGDIDFMFQPHAESFRAQVGYPIGYFYGYKTAGIFQTQEQIDNYRDAKVTGAYAPKPGDVIWVDNNGDGEITTADRTMIGNHKPSMELGFGFNAAYKGFDLSLTVYGVFGNDIMRSWRSWPDSPKDNYAMVDVENRWHGTGTSNTMPRISTNSHPNRQWVSDLYVEKGDYVRLKNITLGYDLKYLMPSTNWLSQLRLYVSAQNLVTVTGYSGTDPEIGWGPQSWVSGIDLGFYPSPRTFMVGANLKF